MDYVAYFLAPLLAVSSETGPLSVYRVGDGHNSGKLACGGEFRPGQRHIAHRRWKQLGCGRQVLLVSHSTGRMAFGTVRDAGPFGVVEVLPKGVKRKPHWRVWTKSLRAPAGWRWRGAVDISYDLWVDLGRPQFLSRVTMHFLPWGFLDKCKDLLRSRSLSSGRLALRPALDELPQVLQYVQLRCSTAHSLHPAGGNANLLGHRLVVQLQQVYAPDEVAGDASTVYGFDVPLGHSSSVAQIAVESSAI